MSNITKEQERNISFEAHLSVGGAIWKVYEVSNEWIVYMEENFAIPQIVASILWGRIEHIGKKKSKIISFLKPELESLIPDFSLIMDMDNAVSRTLNAIQNKEKIVIYGDYDVDGATSSALLKNYFRDIDSELNVSIYIPDRTKEGYGPNINALRKLRSDGFTLCITVDCGTVAHDQIEYANTIGLDVIVIDHHKSDTTLPKAVAVVNPNRIDQIDINGISNLAAVGVCYLFITRIQTRLSSINFFDSSKKQGIPNLTNYLDLVALGTVCDVCKLIGINRALVSEGMKIIDRRKNLGLSLLTEKLGLKSNISIYNLGFNIGPHINAAGRVSDSSLGSKLLSLSREEYSKNAHEICTQLISANNERKQIEKEMLQGALEQAKLNFSTTKNIIVVSSENWNQGIIGIISSKIKDKYHLPSVVISIKDGIGKGSARSVPGADIGGAILAAKASGIIIEGGGHLMAAGFSCEASKISELSIFLEEYFTDIDRNQCRTIVADMFLRIREIDISLCNTLDQLSPYGPGNPEPLFILRNVIVAESRLQETKGVYQAIFCTLKDANTQHKIKATAFCVPESPLKKILYNPICTQSIAKVPELALLVKVKRNTYNGKTFPSLMIDDALLMH